MADILFYSVTLPPLFWAIFAPLFGALVAIVVPRYAALVGLVTMGLTALAVAAMAWQLHTTGTALILELGGWGAPLGIDLRADGLSVLMLAMSTGVGLLVGLGALDTFRTSLGAEVTRQGQYFWPLWLLLLTGINGVYLTTDIFNLYVMIEITSLTAVGLTVLEGTRAALRAGLEYMFASILGAILFLLGVGLIYLSVGRLDFAGLRDAAPGLNMTAALALMFIGMALKTALFPLHFWLPQAHANASAPASAILSALVVKVSLYIVLRLAQYMGFQSEAMIALMGVMGACAIVWGSVQALRAQRLKLLVAYSTVAQIGFIFVAFARAGEVGTAESWKGAAVFMLAHAIAKAAMFLAAGRIKAELGHDRIADFDRSPVRPTLAQFAFALAAISLIGLPPTLGFAGKWILMEGALAAGYWHWVGVSMIGTLLSVAYFSRVFAGFLRFDRLRGPVGQHQGWAMADAAPLTLAFLALGLGLFAAPLLGFMEIGYAFGGRP